MGLIPQIARLVPESLRRFCEGLRNPHMFIFLLPPFIVALVFSHYLPYPEPLLTALGAGAFISSLGVIIAPIMAGTPVV